MQQELEVTKEALQETLEQLSKHPEIIDRITIVLKPNSLLKGGRKPKADK